MRPSTYGVHDHANIARISADYGAIIIQVFSQGLGAICLNMAELANLWNVPPR
jgi:hypothetical protein